MKKIYTNKDVDRVFTQIKNLPEYFQIEKVPQILNNPITKISLPSHSWSTLNFIVSVSVLSIVTIVAILIFHQKDQVRISLPDKTEISENINPIIPKNKILLDSDTNRNIHFYTVVDSSKGELSKVAVFIDSLIPEGKNINVNDTINKSGSDSFNHNSEQEIPPPKPVFQTDLKQEVEPSKSLIQMQGDKKIRKDEIQTNLFYQNREAISTCSDFSGIDTSKNYFTIDSSQYSINSYQFIDEAGGGWKYELDLYYNDSITLWLNFISKGKLDNGFYSISNLMIKDMPLYSCYGSLLTKKEKHKFENARVCINLVGSVYQIFFQVETEKGEKIFGHYKGKLKFTKLNY